MSITAAAKRKQRGSVGMLARGPEVVPAADGETARKDAARQFAAAAAARKAATWPRGWKGVSAETRIVDVAVDKIHRRPSNRGGVAVSPPEVADLMASIEEFGLSVPIEVRPRSEEQDLPVGHFELVKGERRWTAYRCLGLDTIPAIVRDTDEATAAVDVAIDNTQHVGLNPIQRAMAIRDAIGHGVPEQRAGKMYGLASDSGRKNALRLLELPAKVQAAVADGRLAERTARYLMPYAQVPGVMDRVEKSLSGKGWNDLWWLEPSRDESQVKHGVRALVSQLTRPVDGKTKHDYGWQEGSHPCYFRKSIDEELRRELGVVEIRVDNKPIEVATNCKRFDELNQVEIDKRKAAKKAKEKAETNGKAGKTGAADAETIRQQDETLSRKLADWRHRFLRQSIARALKPGCMYSEKVAFWAITQTRSASFAAIDFHAWLQAVAEQRGVPSHELDQLACGGRLSWWGLIDRLTQDDDDPVSDLEHVRFDLARYLLWPVSDRPLDDHCVASGVLVGPGKLPERLPVLDRDEIEEVAEYFARRPHPGLATRFGDAWDRARKPGPERTMFEQLLEYPNKRQLQAWCEEWGIWGQVREWKTLSAQAEGVLELHCGEGKGLRVLQALASKQGSE